MGRRLSPHAIYTQYVNYKKERFPRLLDDPMVLQEDKHKITELLKKPWNPYIRRHTAATEISKSLKDSVLIDQYLGWSHAGNTRQKYQHYYNDDSFDAMLTVMDGLTPPSTITNNSKKRLLKPRQCPNCDETNIPESRFCSKCKFVLTFDAFNEATQDAEATRKRLERLEKTMKSVMKVFMGQSNTIEVQADSDDPETTRILDKLSKKQ
jgi:hypothetical protein